MEFATPESRRAPIYIYDRLDEPSRGMLEENLAAAEGGEVAVTFATGMAAVSGALGILDGQPATRSWRTKSFTVARTA